MKLIYLPLFALLCLGCTVALGAPEAVAAENDAPVEAPAKAPAWTVLGTWKGTHPHWDGTIEILADGTFSWSNGAGGRWVLTADRDRPLLVLLWDVWGTESLAMVTENHFAGKTRFGPFELERQAAAGPKPASESAGPELHTWSQGDPPLKLISKDEGFCALTTVSGGFAGGGEAVWVSVADDGYWYLGGRSQQDGVTATCIVIRYQSLRGASAPKSALTGTWYASGDREKKCEIRRDGGRLVAANEAGETVAVRQDGPDTLTAEDGDTPLKGTRNGDAILWSNQSYWTRAPLR